MCPRLVPAHDGPPYELIAEPSKQDSPAVFSVGWGGGPEDPDPVHVILECVDNPALLGGEMAELWRSAPDRAVPVSERLLSRGPPGMVFFGDVIWGGRRGRVAFQRGFGFHDRHVIFALDEQHRACLLSLHAWSPLEDSILTLKAMAGSMGK